MINALFVRDKGRNPTIDFRAPKPGEMPEGDLEVEVLWSSLNYKDALAVTGRSPIIRSPFPFVPGIDLVGRVSRSDHPDFDIGDLVIQTGYGLGETRFGGFCTTATLQSHQVVHLPRELAPRDAMVVGTAGFTAMLACIALETHGLATGPVVVTGASGGVGSLATWFLSRLGHEVVASTGSTDEAYFTQLGASSILPRSAFSEGAHRPLDAGHWGGAVDSVGGKTLEALISQIGTRGAVAACGLAGGSEICSTVFPFILRGVGLLGIDSNTCPMPLRKEAWRRIATLMEPRLTTLISSEVALAEVPSAAERLLSGGSRGRIVVRVAE